MFEMLNLNAFHPKSNGKWKATRSLRQESFRKMAIGGRAVMRCFMAKQEDAKWVSEKAKDYFKQGFN